MLLLLRKRGPAVFEVRDEVPLSDQPPRLDYMLLRRQETAGRLDVAADGGPVTMRRLWPMDIASMRLSWEACGGGSWRVHGGLFALYVVELDVARPADGDDM